MRREHVIVSAVSTPAAAARKVIQSAARKLIHLITRVAIGPLDVPIGLTPIPLGAVALLILPGLVVGFVRRRRFEAATR
jgi:hypothetical protein